jgi:hypothetical protein
MSKLTEPHTISVCVDCVYFNEYRCLDDTTMRINPDAAVQHAAHIAIKWAFGTTFTSGCANESCEDCRSENPEPWFSWAECEECGSPLGGDREHATAWTFTREATESSYDYGSVPERV